MPVRGVDNTSPEAAYASKPNIVFPGTAAQFTAASTRAANEGIAQGVEDGSPGAAKGVTDAANRHTSTALTTSGTTIVAEKARLTQGPA